MVVAETTLPADAELGLHPERLGPVQATDFELLPQEPEHPMELIGGWILPLTPTGFSTGCLLIDLLVTLNPLSKSRGWCLTPNTRHHLVRPPQSIVFPRVCVHCASDAELLAGGDTITRAPDLVIEILGAETAERDRAPRGAKYLAYQLSGVREYFYAWPDGREAAGFRLEGDVYVPIEPDADGFFPSRVLDASVRLVPAALRDG